MGRIAILMSTYNGERYIEKQLESIANQICNHEIRLYIRDDGSSDNTVQIIKKWNEKLNIYLELGKNVGPARSFWELLLNKVILADYYAFCDQDDIWDNNKLEIAVTHLKGDMHLYACNCRSIDVDGNVIEELRKKKEPDVTIEKLFVSGVTQGCAMVFTNSLRNYILEKNITCITMHDVIVCMYALMYGNFFWDHNPHFSYRFHSNNVVANKSRKGVAAKIETIKRWRKNRNNSLTQVAKELLDNVDIYDNEQNEFIRQMIDAKVSFRSKMYLLRYIGIKNMDEGVLKSFYLRIILNMI